MAHLFMVQLDIPDEHEAEFNRVYDSEHFPMLMKVPGVRGGGRYRLEHSTVPGMQRYLTIYEIDSPDVLKSQAWEKAGAFGDWATSIRPKCTARHHSVFERIAREPVRTKEGAAVAGDAARHPSPQRSSLNGLISGFPTPAR